MLRGQSAADPGFREDAVYLSQRRPPVDVQLRSSRYPDGHLPSPPRPPPPSSELFGTWVLYLKDSMEVAYASGKEPGSGQQDSQPRADVDLDFCSVGSGGWLGKSCQLFPTADCSPVEKMSLALRRK